MNTSTYKYPKNGTIARMILNIIKSYGSRGCMKHEIMNHLFRILYGREYKITEDRGLFSSYFTKINFYYGIVPKFCKKIRRRWVYVG